MKKFLALLLVSLLVLVPVAGALAAVIVPSDGAPLTLNTAYELGKDTEREYVLGPAANVRGDLDLKNYKFILGKTTTLSNTRKLEGVYAIGASGTSTSKSGLTFSNSTGFSYNQIFGTPTPTNYFANISFEGTAPITVSFDSGALPNPISTTAPKQGADVEFSTTAGSGLHRLVLTGKSFGDDSPYSASFNSLTGGSERCYVELAPNVSLTITSGTGTNFNGSITGPISVVNLNQVTTSQGGKLFIAGAYTLRGALNLDQVELDRNITFTSAPTDSKFATSSFALKGIYGTKLMLDGRSFTVKGMQDAQDGLVFAKTSTTPDNFAGTLIIKGFVTRHDAALNGMHVEIYSDATADARFVLANTQNTSRVNSFESLAFRGEANRQAFGVINLNESDLTVNAFSGAAGTIEMTPNSILRFTADSTYVPYIKLTAPTQMSGAQTIFITMPDNIPQTGMEVLTFTEAVPDALRNIVYVSNGIATWIDDGKTLLVKPGNAGLTIDPATALIDYNGGAESKTFRGVITPGPVSNDQTQIVTGNEDITWSIKSGVEYVSKIASYTDATKYIDPALGTLTLTSGDQLVVTVKSDLGTLGPVVVQGQLKNPYHVSSYNVYVRGTSTITLTRSSSTNDVTVTSPTLSVNELNLLKQFGNIQGNVINYTPAMGGINTNTTDVAADPSVIGTFAAGTVSSAVRFNVTVPVGGAIAVRMSCPFNSRSASGTVLNVPTSKNDFLNRYSLSKIFRDEAGGKAGEINLVSTQWNKTLYFDGTTRPPHVQITPLVVIVDGPAPAYATEVVGNGNYGMLLDTVTGVGADGWTLFVYDGKADGVIRDPWVLAQKKSSGGGGGDDNGNSGSSCNAGFLPMLILFALPVAALSIRKRG